MATATGYDGFISCSHHDNRVLGVESQAHLERLARPRRRLRRCRYFVTRLTGLRPPAVGTGEPARSLSWACAAKAKGAAVNGQPVISVRGEAALEVESENATKTRGGCPPLCLVPLAEDASSGVLGGIIGGPYGNVLAQLSSRVLARSRACI
jgi:hypothetical protein